MCSLAEFHLSQLEEYGLSIEHIRQRASIHEAGHVLTFWLMRDADAVTQVTVYVQGTRLGCTDANARRIYTRRQLFARLCTQFGGRVGEKLFYGGVALLDNVDMEKARHLAHYLICKFDIPQRNSLPYIPTEALPSPYGIEIRINNELRRAEEVVTHGLSKQEHRAAIEMVAQALEAETTLNRTN